MTRSELLDLIEEIRPDVTKEVFDPFTDQQLRDYLINYAVEQLFALYD